MFKFHCGECGKEVDKSEGLPIRLINANDKREHRYLWVCGDCFGLFEQDDKFYMSEVNIPFISYPFI